MGSMRDLVWTLIVIWFIFQLVNMFRPRRSVKSDKQSEPQVLKKPSASAGKTGSRFDHEGEYVDFEEVR